MKQLRALTTGLTAAAILIALAGDLRASPATASNPGTGPDRKQAGSLAPLAPAWQPWRSPATASPARLMSQAAPAATPAPAPAKPVPPTTCKRDEECPAGTICTDGACRAFERSINILLFRKEGPVTAVLPFYWSRTGTPGYRVIAPLYWHFWSAEGKSRVVFPLFWRFRDHLAQRTVTVFVPYVHTIQPDAESWAFWPIFYRSTKFGWAAPLLGSLKIGSPDERRAWGFWLFLYFWKRSPTSALDVSPLFVSSRRAGGAFTWVLPLNFYWRSGNDKNLVIAPLLFRSWAAQRSLTVSPLGFRSTAEGGSSSGSVLWLYWYGRRTDRQHDVLFPLVWSFRSPRANTTVVPPFLHLRRGTRSFNALIPLYLSSSDSAKGEGWRLLLPLFFSRTGEQGKTFSWITLLGGYRRDDVEGTRALTFLVPPLIYRRDAQREFQSLLLLYWKYQDIPGNATTRLIGPLYLRSDPRGASRVLFPLFWYFRDEPTHATAHTLVPLYFRRSSPEEKTTAVGVFPLWFYYRSFTDGGRSAGLMPIAYFGSRAGRSHAVLFPLLWHFADQRSSATLAIPFYYRFADEQRASAGVPPLLYFQGRDHGDSYKVQVPLFWRFHNAREQTTTTVVPPVFYRSRPGGWSAGIAPLLFAGGGAERRHFVLFPLFWHRRDDKQDRTTTVVANYLHRRHGGETTDAFFPILHWRRGARPGGQHETSFTLAPLVHYRRTAASTLFLSPIAAWGRGKETRAGVILPYFWYQNRELAASGVPPLYFDVTRLGTGERTRVFGPYFRMNAPGRSAHVLFPLFGRYTDEKETSTYVFPVFFRRRTTEGYKVDTLFPLLWFSSAPGYSTQVVGPFFHKSGPGSRSYGLLPLFARAANQERRFVITPLYVNYKRVKEGTSRSFSLLYYSSFQPDGYTRVIFPLWWSGRDKEESYKVGFPLLWHFANSRENKSFTLAGPILWSRSGEYRTRGLMPLFWFSYNGKGSGSTAVVPLFYEKHTPNSQLLVTAIFGFKTAPDRGWFYVGPFYRSDAWNRSFWTLFPLFFSHHDKVTETRTRVVPPLLLYSKSSPEKGLFGAALLFWRSRDITSSTTLGLPLFYDVHSYHEKRITLFLPFFLRYRNHVTATSYVFAPLFYRRSSPNDSTTVAFPLVWDFRGADRRTTIVVPFYFGFRRPTWHGRFIFPNIWYRTGLGPEAGTSRLWIFPFWESAVKRPGDYMWEVLLGLFGWESIGRNRYMKLFFIPIELDPAPAAKTAAWYGKPPPASKRKSARGLSTQVW